MEPRSCSIEALLLQWSLVGARVLRGAWLEPPGLLHWGSTGAWSQNRASLRGLHRRTNARSTQIPHPLIASFKHPCKTNALFKHQLFAAAPFKLHPPLTCTNKAPTTLPVAPSPAKLCITVRRRQLQAHGNGRWIGFGVIWGLWGWTAIQRRALVTLWAAEDRIQRGESCRSTVGAMGSGVDFSLPRVGDYVCNWFSQSGG